MIYLYLFGTCFHFIYVFMIIGNKLCIKAAFAVMQTVNMSLYSVVVKRDMQ